LLHCRSGFENLGKLDCGLAHTCCKEIEEEKELQSKIVITSVKQQLFPCPEYGPGFRLEWELVSGAQNYIIEYNDGSGWKLFMNRSKEYGGWANFIQPNIIKNCTINGQFCSRCVEFGKVYEFRIKAQDENNNDITLWSDVVFGNYTKKIKIKKVNIFTAEDLRQQNPSISKAVSGETNFYINELINIEKHPIVLYTADELVEIKQRIKREPYSKWWREIKDKHEWVLNYDIMKWNRIQKARYAKIMAFVYAITKEEKYGDMARNLLLNMNYGGYNKEHFEDIDSLVWFAEAYDMLKGANYNFEKNPNLDGCTYDCGCKNIFGWKFWCTKKCGTCESVIRKNLKEQTKQVAETDITEISGDTLTRKNNHHIRRYSAVGISALVLNDAKYFNNVMEGGTTYGVVGKLADNVVNLFSDTVSFDYDGVQHAIHHQIIDNKEGGWREGPYYLRYSFTTGIPFMIAMKNYGNGINGWHDWLNVEKLKNLFNWGVKIRMPNGARPPFDDSNMDFNYFFGGYLDNAVHNWDWINSEKPYFSNSDSAVTKIDALCYYDDSVGQKEPDWNPTQFLSKTGQIIFRSDWGKDAVYLAFLGETGRALDDEFKFAGKTYTHEHRDTMSFILYAYGKYLALDSGYINWDNREKVSKPENHNVVLIDGEIAEDGLIVEDDFFSIDYLDYGEIRNSKGHDRGILFVDKKYFLVFDDLKSNKYRDYKWLLHGNGNFNEYSSRSREWVQDNVGLLAYVLPSSAVITSGTDVHCNSWNNVEKHTYMSVFKKGKNVGFLSLLYPAKNRVYPKISEDNGILKFEKDDWKGIAFVNEERKLFELSELGVKTDASKFFAKIKNNNLEYIFADDVTKFYVDDREVFSRSNPTTILVKFAL